MTLQTLELSVRGMDCPSCAGHLEAALLRVPGVREAAVSVAAARATLKYDPEQVSTDRIRGVVRAAGYEPGAEQAEAGPAGPGYSSPLVFGAIGLVVLLLSLGEHSGLLDRVLAPAPAPLLAAGLLVAGWNSFREVGRSLLRRQLTSHALLTLGVLAAAVIGEWATAGILILFMRLADLIEGLTVRGGREAVQHLLEARPATARVLLHGIEVEKPVGEVEPGQFVLVRPGERVPVDGVVVEGVAPVDEAPVTGESVPRDKGPGDSVHAATVVQAGALTVRATRTGADTTYARIIRLVEEAELQKTPVQRLAGRFTAGYLPVVLLLALGTYFLSGRVEQAVSVLVVACACSIVLATPVVVIASVACAARQGVLVKGGVTLEQLARVDTVVLDKTGTLTHGRPRVTDVLPLDGSAPGTLLRNVAAVETRSEHPLGRAMVLAAREERLHPGAATEFRYLPGQGVTGRLESETWAVGSRALLAGQGISLAPEVEARAAELEREGKTVLFAAANGSVRGVVALRDTARPEMGEAIRQLRELGIRSFLVLTGDQEVAAAAAARELGIEWRAGLLPEDKIAAVRELQAAGSRVLMVGDGVNDAPALRQADVGLAMGSGADAAIEAADAVLLREDWTLVPEAVRVGRRAARTIRQNLVFSALYNVVGIGAAAAGLLPPVWAAAAHNLPDVVILLNSSRLMRLGRSSTQGSSPGAGKRAEAIHSHPRDTDGHAHFHGHAHVHDERGGCGHHGHSHAHGHCGGTARA